MIAIAVLIALLMVTAVSALTAVVTAVVPWLAWKYVACAVFGAPTLTFLQIWLVWFVVCLLSGVLGQWRSADK